MSRPAALRAHHFMMNRIVAIILTWMISIAPFPASAFSFTEPPGLGRPASPIVIPALPALSPATEEFVPVAGAAPEPQPANDADDEEQAHKWGEITVGQPKIWQYERVNSMLDGLLRDVQGVSLSDLIGLDANATNGAAVKFVQSMLEIGVKYDQGAGVLNNIALQNYSATQGVASAQIEANKAYLQQLDGQRTSVTTQLLAAVQQNAGLQVQLATTDPTSAAYKSLATQQQAAASEVAGLQAELTSINSQITAASSTTMPAAPSLTSTAGVTPTENPNTFSSFLAGLPTDLTKNIVSQLQTPSFPATKRLDNFITLLYERLAREISVLQDDVMRDTDNVPFLVQFDVGLYPASQAKNHVAVAEFGLNCDGCKVYSIYPGQSSYNLANYEGASKRYSLWGALATLIGFGINADYRRQTDTLRGDLVQSVYMSGFQEGAPLGHRSEDKLIPSQRFGWYYGASPFELLVTPGIRSTFAIISVPRRLLKSCQHAAFENVKPAGSESDEYHKLLAAAKIKRTAANEADQIASTGSAATKPLETSDAEKKATEADREAAVADARVCLQDGISAEGEDLQKRLRLQIDASTDWVRRDDPFYQQTDTLHNSLPSAILTGMSRLSGISMNLKKRSKFAVPKKLAGSPARNR